MPLTTLFIDLDDTLYPPSTGVWELIRQRIDLYIHDRLVLPWEQVPILRSTLFEEYGTTMRGLQARYHIDEQDYLAFVHDVPVDRLLQPDPVLAKVLARYPQVIFTNADARHAVRVLQALQLSGIFDQIIDICALAPHCKPQLPAFQIALDLAGESDPSRCLLVDDQLTNVTAARQFGFQTVFITNNHSGINFTPSLPSLRHLPQIVSPS
jgi:putative hydrolase of the HAD superfamily